MIIEEELSKEEIAMFTKENTPLWRLCCAMATNIELNMRKIKELENQLKKHETTVGLHSDRI